MQVNICFYVPMSYLAYPYILRIFFPFIVSLTSVAYDKMGVSMLICSFKKYQVLPFSRHYFKHRG